MKYLFMIIITLTLSFPLFAGKNSLLVCFGKEEAIIHKNHLEGPLYNLNQQLINEVINLNEIPVKKKFLDEICNLKSDYSPSVNFLRFLLLEGKGIFEETSSISDVLAQMKILGVESLTSHSPAIFFNYLSSLQAMAKSPNCLDKKIPEMNKLMDRFRYLEAELTVEELLKEKENIQKIFKALKNFDKILEECAPKPKAPPPPKG